MIGHHTLYTLQRNIVGFTKCFSRAEQTHTVQAQSDSHADIKDFFSLHRQLFMED